MTRFFTLAAAAALLIVAPALAEHDHDHPDLKIEADGTQLKLHGHPVAHNHEHYEFVDVGSAWVTQHDGLTWPGIGAEDATFPASSTADLIIKTDLYYWNGVSIGGFTKVPGGDTTHITVKPSAFGKTYSISGISGEQSLADFIAADSEGGVHMHPIWELLGNGGAVPADGAYAFGVCVDADGFLPSEMQGVLFHKGLSHDLYEAAVDHALAAGIPDPATLLLGDANRDDVVSADDYASVQVHFGDTGPIGISGDANLDGAVSADDYASVQLHFGATAGGVPIPEPATISLLTIGGLVILRRRKFRAKRRRLVNKTIAQVFCG